MVCVISFKYYYLGLSSDAQQTRVIFKWHSLVRFVKPGDHVNQFDSICEVQSDKVRSTLQQENDLICINHYFFISMTVHVCICCIINILVFWPFQLQQKEKTNSGYKHNSKVSHGIFNLTFRMLQHF